MKKVLLLALAIVATSINTGCAVVAVGAVTGAAMVAHDRRTMDTMVADESIELKAARKIAEDKLLKDKVRVEVISYNRQVLLVGQAPNQNLRMRATTLVRAIEGVNAVHNQIRIGEIIGMGQRTKDSYITSKIKSKMAMEEQVDPTRFKVVTENGEVFLMGIASRDEAKHAIDIARHTGGVKKVIDLIQYL